MMVTPKGPGFYLLVSRLPLITPSLCLVDCTEAHFMTALKNKIHSPDYDAVPCGEVSVY